MFKHTIDDVDELLDLFGDDMVSKLVLQQARSLLIGTRNRVGGVVSVGVSASKVDDKPSETQPLRLGVDPQHLTHLGNSKDLLASGATSIWQDLKPFSDPTTSVLTNPVTTTPVKPNDGALGAGSENRENKPREEVRGGMDFSGTWRLRGGDIGEVHREIFDAALELYGADTGAWTVMITKEKEKSLHSLDKNGFCPINRNYDLVERVLPGAVFKKLF